MTPGETRAASPEVRATLLEAITPLLSSVGGRVVKQEEAEPEDVPLVWDGETLFHVRLGTAPPSAASPADLSDGLSRLIAEVEQELGAQLAQLPRADKQRAVRLLEERGAFEMRRSAETVAEALGVTRFTVYNYLNRSPSPPS